MRNAFAEEITAAAAEDDRVVLLAGDIGNRLFDGFQERCAGRFFNCGVAEANLMSVAAGMAMCGFRPFTYSITPFITTRCLEQIRVDVCYHEQPVTIVGTGSGLAYASLGATHHSTDDIGFLRLLPNMTVVCPGDPVEVRLAVRAILEHDGPVYLRLGKKGEPVVHESAPDFRIGKAIELSTGDEVSILSTGAILGTALEVARSLEERGIAAGVFSMHTVKPLDETALDRVFETARVVVTLEEHSLIAGLGGAVAEWLADRGPTRARLVRCGVPDDFVHVAGEQEDALARFGLTPHAVTDRIVRALREIEVTGATR